MEVILWVKRVWILDIRKLLILKMVKDLDMFKMFVLIYKAVVLHLLLFHGSSKPFNLFAGSNDIVIEWSKIKCIGENVILVEI